MTRATAPATSRPTWRGRLAVWAYRVLDGATAAIPRRVGVRLCWLGGAVWYLAAPGARRAVTRNLTQILGHPPAPALVRRVFQHGLLNYWDIFLGSHLTQARLHALFEIRNLDLIDAGLAAGHGVVIFSGHLGSISLGGVWLGSRGYQATTVVEVVEPPELMDLFLARRSGGYVRVVPARSSILRDLLRTMRRNEVVGLITDRDVLGTGMEVMFFGRPTRFPVGVAVLALRTGAPILPAFVLQRPNGDLDGWIEPPLPKPDTGSFEQDVKLLTQEVANSLAYHIAQHPEQWTVFQEYWPDDAGPVGGR